MPPSKLDDDYLRRKLEAISKSQARQNQIEAERTGAGKSQARLIAIFGTLITAAAIGGFGWVWSTSADTARQSAAIERISERQSDHDPAPPGHDEIEAAIHSNDRRIDASEQTMRTINERLDRIERESGERHREVLEELRRLRNARRTWGGR